MSRFSVRTHKRHAVKWCEPHHYPGASWVDEIGVCGAKRRVDRVNGKSVFQPWPKIGKAK